MLKIALDQVIGDLVRSDDLTYDEMCESTLRAREFLSLGALKAMRYVQQLMPMPLAWRWQRSFAEVGDSAE